MGRRRPEVEQGQGRHRIGNLQTAGALSGRRGVDRPGRTAETAPPSETSTGRWTGGGRGHSGSPAGEKAEVPLSPGMQIDKLTVRIPRLMH